MPNLLRSGYVGNMNDSYWLSTPNQPLTGFAAIFGPAGSPAPSLRTRLGHRMALPRLAGTDGYGGQLASSEIVQQMQLNSRIASARFKDEILRLVCQGDNAGPRTSTCAVLAIWDNRGLATSRSSHIWDEFWMNLSAVPSNTLYLTPFEAQDPLNARRDIHPAARSQLTLAFNMAVKTLQDSGCALDAPRGEVLFLMRNSQRRPLYCGCGGDFSIHCSEFRLIARGYTMDEQPHGNSYMQVVNFPAGKLEAYTFLTFSRSDNPASAHYGNYNRDYSAQTWLKLPFSEAGIKASPALRTRTISE